MKIYVKSETNITNDNTDIIEHIGDFVCVVHPDRTVDCYKFWVRTPEDAIYPNRTVKKTLKDKYGNDLLFLDDIEKNTPINSIEEAEQIILNSNVDSNIGISQFKDENINRLKAWLIDPDSVGSKRIGRYDTNKTKPTSTDFRDVIGVNQEVFLSALRMLHPGKEITLTFDHRNRDKYAHKGIYAEPAHTTWKIDIS